MQEKVNRSAEKQFEILCRVWDLCTQNGIKAYLIEEAALAAALSGDACDYPKIAIDIRDASKLTTAVQKTSGLEVHGFFNDPKHSVYSLHIYDPGTIDFNVTDFYRKNYCCMKITVKMLRTDSPGRAGKSLTGKMLDAAKSASGDSGARLRSAAMQALGKVYAAGKGGLILGKNKFDRSFIDAAKEVSVQGRTFRIPGNTEKYFESMYGSFWREHEIKVFTETREHFRDADHSWEEYRRRLENIDIKAYVQLRKDYEPLYTNFTEARDKVESNYVILERTNARIQLWKRYKDKKQTILELMNEKKISEAAGLLQEYMDEMLRFYDLGLGLCFDPELLDAACAVFESRGMKETADRMKALVPAQHMKPFTLLDYRGKEI